MSKAKVEDVAALQNAYANAGDFGRKKMEKRYPHVKFVKPEREIISVDDEGDDGILGKLLARGNGSGVSAIGMWWLFFAVQIAICIVLMVMYGDLVRVETFGGAAWMAVEGEFGPFFWVFLILAIVAFLMAAMTGAAISSSEIQVYEGGVKGRGISKWFLFGDMRTFDFMLTLEEANIDVSGEKVTVFGPGTSYRVYAKNAAEIRDAIFRLKK